MTQVQKDEDLCDKLSEGSSDQMANQIGSTRDESIDAMNRINVHRTVTSPLLSESSRARCLCELGIGASERDQKSLPGLFEMDFSECPCNNRASCFIDCNNHIEFYFEES